MIRLVVDNGPDPMAAAWAEFDAAAIDLQAMYANPAGASSLARCEQAIEVARAWERWRSLFLNWEAAEADDAARGDDPKEPA